ncbi:DUF1223 domain-containing protein [Rhizobium sp. 2MFCol3.1]|uniref:DUF1223 domain-containing protein n=1 Tax=Rhizobium sp. 2MFCol3.1 TaxID=1246459 RepID=UPI001FD8795F|nr:DUF1223 domain-containing protein [Rhizobium sp. 2MFCol3.1]
MIPKSACPLWPADNRSDLGRKARHSAASYTTYGDTIQGCSSCPPANANLIKLSKRDDVLTLSFSVTYWDYLGWRDSFGKQVFTERQAAYEPALQQSGSYTPQMIVNGATTTVGNDYAEINRLLSQAKPLKSPLLSLNKTSVSVGRGPIPAGPADVWLVRYDPNLVEVPVARGENSGITLPHIHVVHELIHLGAWSLERRGDLLHVCPDIWSLQNSHPRTKCPRRSDIVGK